MKKLTPDDLLKLAKKRAIKKLYKLGFWTIDYNKYGTPYSLIAEQDALDYLDIDEYHRSSNSLITYDNGKIRISIEKETKNETI
ncbi:MAG: hypothetical protein GY853_14030 [PVC group bacterium]|nr:hypothetical protein [PVC group bacterium]